MVNGTLKILRCEHREIFKVCLVIFQHFARMGYNHDNNDDAELLLRNS